MRRAGLSRIRGGFTLVEIMIVTALATLLAGSVLLVQRSVVRRTMTTDAKRDAVVQTHRAYESIHFALMNSQRYWIPSNVVGAYEYDDRVGAPLLLTPDQALTFSAQRRSLRMGDSASVEGISRAAFFREGDFRASFVLDSAAEGDRTPLRERSTLLSSHFFEIESDRQTFDKAWWQAGGYKVEVDDQPDLRYAPISLNGPVGVPSSCGLSGYVPEK